MSLALALSAWHAHGLVEQLDPDAYQAFGRGLHQQTLAAFGLMASGLLLHGAKTRLVQWAALGLCVGVLLFCGDVYWGALTGEGLGVAPVGGSLSILSWLLLAFSQLLSPRESVPSP